MSYDPKTYPRGVASHVLFFLDRKFTGSRLREARELNQWSQADLAKRTGLPAAAISHWETGRRMPNLENFWTLLFVLQIDAEYILGLGQNAKTEGPPTETSTKENQ